MRKKYQSREHKSNHKFEVIGGQELLVRVPLQTATLEGSRIRKSLDTGDWSKAQRGAAELAEQLTGERRKTGEAVESSAVAEAQELPTIAKAQEMYLADAKARGLKKHTIDRHRIIFKQLTAFAEVRGIKYLSQL